MAARAPEAQHLPPRVVLFDGVCVICNRTVRWLMRRDPARRLRYATLQGETAASLRSRHAEIPEALATVVYVDATSGGERVYRDSDGLFRVLRELDGPARHLARLAVFPRWLTDVFYRAFVANRYRLFGKYDTCPVPSEEERALILD